MYLPEQTHLAPLVTVRRERCLPVPGEVLARMDERVEALDVVARAHVKPAHRILDVARLMGASPAEADKLITCKAGDVVQAGDALAQRRGLTRRTIPSPMDARVVAAGGGQILLQGQSEPLQLKAMMPGVVVNVMPELGVTVETTGALIQGVWGNGRQDFGVMRVLTEDPASPLTADHIDVSHRGAVLCAGLLTDSDALRLAGDMQLRGLILGGLPSSLHAQAQRAPFPIVLTEGWGERPMCAPAFQLLHSNSGREVALDGLPTDRYRGTRPEIIIPLPAAGARAGLPNEGEALSVGQRVRVVRAPYAGAVGILTAIGERPVSLPSGLRAPSGKVELEGFGSVWVPFPNLEILE